ncbi:MAG: coproporphyrinogen-III oxidase family protein, partial [Thermoanaerobaculia bacterium]
MTAAPRRPGLYVHVPFCTRICPYCDFAVTRGGPERRSSFVRALLREVASVAPLWRERSGAEPFDTIYFGGGTPSLLEPGELASVLDAVQEQLPVAPGARLSLEANPEDATPERLAALRELGVATLSLGVQSFDPRALRFLGRRHRPEEARRAVERALEAGFPTVSVDLIFGLPAAIQGE